MTASETISSMDEFVAVTVPDGKFRAFVARPSKRPTACILVLHELFGINDDMKATCREVANRGYLALCPDLFWRQEPGVSLSHFDETDWRKGWALGAAFDINKGVADISAAISVARTLSDPPAKVGVMGYCLGGLLTFLTATRTGADAAVAYYPGGADKYLDEADRITTPIIVHLGDEDEYISKDEQQAIGSALSRNPDAEVFGYPYRSHAFARHGGEHYDAAAAALAHGRTWTHFDRNLQRDQ